MFSLEYELFFSKDGEMNLNAALRAHGRATLRRCLYEMLPTDQAG